MLESVFVVVMAAAALLALVSGIYALRDRLLDDWLLLAAAVLELGLLVQLVAGLVSLGDLAAEKATFAAYAITLPFIPPAIAWVALKEKTRWAMGVVVAGSLAVLVMTARLDSLWGLHA